MQMQSHTLRSFGKRAAHQSRQQRPGLERENVGPLGLPVEEQAPSTADSPAFFTPFFPSLWRSDRTLSSGVRGERASRRAGPGGCGSCANDHPLPASRCGAEAALELEEEGSLTCWPRAANSSQQEAVLRSASPNWWTEAWAESQACGPRLPGAPGVGGL